LSRLRFSKAMAAEEFLPKLLRRNVPPQLTLDHVSPATRLLEKRRQKIEVQEALEAQKADFERREEQFQRREQIIKKKDLELQENLIRFNKFLQENDTKRTRAEKKFVEEERKKNEHTAAIKEYEKEFEKLKLENEKQNEELNKNQKYLTYLEATCESQGDEYGEPLDLQNRHKTLMESNSDLVSRRKEGEECKNLRLIEFRKYQQERSTESQVVNTRIAQMRLQYDDLKQEVSKLEVFVEKSEAEKMDRKHLIGQVEMAVENTFARCVAQTTLKSKAEKYTAGNNLIMDQLDFIAEYYLDLKGISKAHTDKQKEDRKRQEQELLNL